MNPGKFRNPLELLQNSRGRWALGLTLLFAALGVGLVMAVLPMQMGIVLLAVIIGIPALGYCIYDQYFGLHVAVVIAILIGFLSKIRDAPYGLLLDVLLLLLFLGLMVKQMRSRDASIMSHPLSYLVLIWISYMLVQVVNPWAGSRMAWVYTVRSLAGLILIYFVALYAIDSMRSIQRLVNFLIIAALISAWYGIYQEWIGFPQFELTWLYADDERFQLIVQWSRFRVFSFFSDPTTFGIYMAYMSTFTLVMATGKVNPKRRFFLLFSAVSMILGMAYAGSRTPIVLLPFGVLLFALFTLKKEVFIGVGLFMMAGTVLVFKGSSNAVIFRIQSAFNPKYSDDTMKVRFKNQKRVRPFLHSHPFGAGLGSTGYWAKRFTPDSWLAKFAHDSAFVRIAVEAGWIGLLIYMALLFTICRYGLYYYNRINDPYSKTLYLAMTLVFFELTLASYPQEAITLLPNSIYFYILIAIMVRLKDFAPLPSHVQLTNRWGKPETMLPETAGSGNPA